MVRRLVAVVTLLVIPGFFILTGSVGAQDDGAVGTPVDQLSDFALWGIVAGAASSFLAGVINKSHWPSTVKFGVFFLFCVVGAAGDAYFQRSLDFHNWSRALLVVLAAGITTYMTQKRVITEVERRTNVL